MSCSCLGAEAPEGRPVAQVLLDSALPQLDHLFDYSIPEELADSLRVGQRVKVPFRSQQRKSFGYVIGFVERSDFTGELSPIAEIVGPVPQLTPEVWQLARAVADRAGGSAGDILRLAIPTRQIRVEKQHLQAAVDTSRAAAARDVESGSTQDPTSDTAGTEVAPGPEQEQEVALEIAERLILGKRLGFTASHSPVRLPTGEWVGGWAEGLAKLAIAVHKQRRSVIVVLPDYRDEDQVLDALDALGHCEAVRVDSRQSNAERYAAFLRALDREPRIIVGNRSAVYAPAHELGAILMWDDGDPVLAEPLTPYVHARDAALVRAELEGAGLFFAAHARSAEVERLVMIGYVDDQVNPPRRTRMLHADASIAPDAFAGRVPEFAARTIREGLRTGPVLVQVATPGYAPVSVCGDCGDLARCKACGGPIGFRIAGRAACRWCGEHANPWSCLSCGAHRLVERGMGSARTVEQFERQFRGFRVLLSDGDHPRERVDSRPALIVATRGAEPIAAGGYRAVVLLDAERLLSLEHLRAGEDCIRWWENAAALAAPDGVCLMASGGGPVVQAFVTGRVEEWLRGELRDRQALRYPPAVRVASVTGGLAEVDRAIAALSSPGVLPGVEVLGPTPFAPRDAAPQGAQLVRAIIRFEYGRGTDVAKRLRGALVADAAGAQSRQKGRAPGRARPEALRLRFDDRGVFDG
ncbi:hypothetical protein [Leucobacter denitrificans]|uniref:Primosomal protein N' 3' DNA-binding domain-containing protein n=1 Tax=Leucobacter denitrificans TaxID=683042 RepID=A0A7G9S626_9MICO|nr:hypothetical protein [Leucobacter denitrificans]QNN63301.1 hypothetical protein H9L06_02895 [Leucobacter denitrificans]